MIGFQAARRKSFLWAAGHFRLSALAVMPMISSMSADF
jgi:hypothetical protein